MIEISEGRTNNYLIHGVILMITVIILFVIANTIQPFFFIPTFILFMVALFLFTASNGLEIDPKKARYRKYGKIGPIKFGMWHHFSDPVSASLIMHSSNAYLGNAPLMGKAATVDTKAITYDIIVNDAVGKSTCIYDFLDYTSAKKALKTMREVFDIPVTNKVADKLYENRLKRKRRR